MSTPTAYQFPLAAAPQLSTPANCDLGYTNLTLTALDVAAQWILPTLRACSKPVYTNQTLTSFQIEVINAGPAVWVVDNINGWDARGLNVDDLTLSTFRRETQSLYRGLALEPGQQVYGSVLPSADLTFRLNPSLQLAWEVTSRLIAAAKERVTEFVLSSLTNTTRAIGKCALVGYDVGMDLRPLNSDTDESAVLDDAYSSVRAARQCSEALDAARSEGALTQEDVSARTVDEEAQVTESRFTIIATELEEHLDILRRVHD